jgi:PleD family two-component response regulator
LAGASCFGYGLVLPATREKAAWRFVGLSPMKVYLYGIVRRERTLTGTLRTEAASQMDKKSPEKDVSALLVGEYESDRFLVHEVFKKLGWKLFEARDRRRAMQYLKRNPVQVVIAKTDVPNWSWRGVLTDLRSLAKPPQLIVTSLTADESLWAEVLNVGGYDVMAQPFEQYEVERVVASAYRHFSGQPVRVAASPV